MEIINYSDIEKLAQDIKMPKSKLEALYAFVDIKPEDIDNPDNEEAKKFIINSMNMYMSDVVGIYNVDLMENVSSSFVEQLNIKDKIYKSIQNLIEQSMKPKEFNKKSKSEILSFVINKKQEILNEFINECLSQDDVQTDEQVLVNELEKEVKNYEINNDDLKDVEKFGVIDKDDDINSFDIDENEEDTDIFEIDEDDNLLEVDINEISDEKIEGKPKNSISDKIKSINTFTAYNDKF